MPSTATSRGTPMDACKQPLPINQKTITGPAYLTTIWPAPHIKENTEYIAAGPVTIGVEYRYLKTADPEEGVCLHVFSPEPSGLLEYLRFDCFFDGPHYHYMVQGEKRQEVFPMDRVAAGDSLQWSIGCLKERLAPMLAHAGAPDLARGVEARRSEVLAALPRVAAAADRAVAAVRRAQQAAPAAQTRAMKAGG